ncbi:hypothetical protein C6P74_24025 [Burkholderia multivorans]|uniref:hypothetical protein n=1 Tax=Burkholderia multivorans TaxID=87883 RepID=UPI000D414769|nr:hypothetical protein [Burkholderia multivorans]PRD76159.1 hypothetical protein C6P74_24025 [Burkholderia multivorans]
MLTVDLPLDTNLKELITKLEKDTLAKIATGVDVRGQTYHAIRDGQVICQVEEEEEKIPSALAELKADHLLMLLVENNKGEDFKAGGTINIHIYSPKYTFEGYTDLYLNEHGARVVAPMEWQAWDGNIGYFK